MLDPLVSGLNAALGSPESTVTVQVSAAPVDPVQSREVAGQLAQLLSEFDPGAADFIVAHRAALVPLFGEEAWQQFENLVQGYVFAEAEAKLEQALKEPPKA